jgi:thiol:disulfide interchange protein
VSITRKKERIAYKETNVIKAINTYHEAFLARTASTYILSITSDRPKAAELGNKCIFTLTFTYNNALLIAFNVILQMTLVPCFLPMIAALPASCRLRATPSTSMNKIEPFGECVAAQASLAVGYTVKKLASLRWL